MLTYVTRRGILGLLVVVLLAAVSAALAAPGLLAPIIEQSDKTILLEPVATGLTAPNWGTTAPGDADRLFVSDQNGILWAIDLASGNKTVFLDVSSRLVPLGAFGPGTYDERGFLGVAFHPGYQSNGLLYTYTSEPVNGPADFSTMPPGTTPNSVVDPNSARELMRIDEPQFNHNAGTLIFGPDGMLYMSLGDGGQADDQGVGHGSGNAQNPSNILGDILRIDPLGSNSANGQYGIPADNPFVGMPGYAAEVYAYGFRNPFRMSFDMQTGDLYVGDVGQNDIEEVDVVVAGGNYGWNVKEGSFCFNPNGTGEGFAYDQDPCPGETANMIDPVAEYNVAESLDENWDGRAVIGGYVYRGSAIPGLVGRYIFGDYTRFTEDNVNNDGRLFFLNKKNIVGDHRIKSSKIFEFQLAGQEALGMAVTGIGQDASGELYVLGNEVGIPFGTTGVVLKIVPAP